MTDEERKVAAELFGVMMLQHCKPAIASFARMLVVDTGLVPEVEQAAELTKLTEDFEKSFTPVLVEFGEEIIGTVEKTQASTIDAVVRYMADEGHGIRSTDTAFDWFARIVRGLQVGDWKKHALSALPVSSSEKPS